MDDRSQSEILAAQDRQGIDDLCALGRGLRIAAVISIVVMALVFWYKPAHADAPSPYETFHSTVCGIPVEYVSWTQPPTQMVYETPKQGLTYTPIDPIKPTPINPGNGSYHPPIAPVDNSSAYWNALGGILSLILVGAWLQRSPV